jgi:hypothetical protein
MYPALPYHDNVDTLSLRNKLRLLSQAALTVFACLKNAALSNLTNVLSVYLAWRYGVLAHYADNIASTLYKNL